MSDYSERAIAVLVSTSEISTAITAIAFGILANTGVSHFPDLVRLFIFLGGIIALILSVNISIKYLTEKLLSIEYWRCLLGIYLLLGAGLLLSFSPVLNKLIANSIIFPNNP